MKLIKLDISGIKAASYRCESAPVLSIAMQGAVDLQDKLPKLLLAEVLLVRSA